MKKKNAVWIKEHLNAGKVVPAHERGAGKPAKSKEEIISLFDDIMNDPLSPTINSKELKLKYMQEHRTNPKVLQNIWNQANGDHFIMSYIVANATDTELLKHIRDTAKINAYKNEAIYRLKKQI